MVYLNSEEKKRNELISAHDKMEEAKIEAKKEAKEILESAKKDAQTVKKEAEIIAKKEASIILHDAKAEATKIKDKGTLDIENERKAMQESLRSKILEVALKLNEKLFSKSEVNKDFIAKSLENEKV